MAKDISCNKCGKVPKEIIRWNRKWDCPECDENRRREDILNQGTIIDDDGLPCEGCLFGIRSVDMHVIDPDGSGPYHRECALANCGEGQSVRLAPDEIVEIPLKMFSKLGNKVYKQ